ncbi:YrhK family protein [Alphaproteobacteria bacterium KMM 3653]|uniref:YrhK family protein n=1 Tax=Harenicola maris TaxID=2841044 RepID=A0AAP2G5B2_9RHOB|nr:YrhK family protein [Harenicola maris]
MTLFHPDNRNRSDDHKRIYALYEIAYTVNDFGAAVLFILGSALFFDDATATLATWLFLIGSLMFGLRPAIKLAREIKFLRMGNYDDITRR